MNPNDFEPLVLVTPYHLGVMLTNSVQYALRRSTGMPLLVQSMFKAYLPSVTDHALDMALRDILHAKRMGEIPDRGSLCEWAETERLLRDELARRERNFQE